MDKLRPCIVTPIRPRNHSREGNEAKRGYFHQWGNFANVIIGGHNDGVASSTVGIVEYEDGTVESVYPYQIKFTDRGQENG